MSGTLRKRRGFTSLPNATVHDQRLSYRSLGLLLALHSRPDGASYDMRQLAKGENREGRTALLKSATELRETGYLASRQIRVPNDTGKPVFHTLTIVDTEPMTPERAAQELDQMAQGQVIHNAFAGSGFQTPQMRTPQSRTLSSTKSQPPSSTRFAREEEEKANVRECEHGEPRGSMACPLCRQAMRS